MNDKFSAIYSCHFAAMVVSLPLQCIEKCLACPAVNVWVVDIHTPGSLLMHRSLGTKAEFVCVRA